MNFHHNWHDHLKQSENPFSFVKHHVLLSLANDIQEADNFFRPLLSTELFKKIVDLIPNQWLDAAHFNDHPLYKKGYVDFLSNRLSKSELFVREARNARS